MSDVTTANLLNATAPQKQQMLRQVANQLVGGLFYGTMLKMASDSPVKGTIGHGGRGEEMFQTLLNQELANRASARMDSSLTDAIVKRFEKAVKRGEQ